MFTITGYGKNEQFTEIKDVANYILNFYKYDIDGGASYHEEIFQDVVSMQSDGFNDYDEDEAAERLDNSIIDDLTFDLDHLYNSTMERYGLIVEHKAT